MPRFNHRSRNLLCLGVVLSLLLTVALPTPISVLAQGSTSNENPTTCQFQPPAADRSATIEVIRPITVDNGTITWDNTYVGLHRWNAAQWPAVDILVDSTVAFKSGGVVSWVGWDGAGGGNSIMIDGQGDCQGWRQFMGHLSYNAADTYSVGQEIGPDEVVGKPGCSGFEDFCTETSEKGTIPPHNHTTLGYWSNVFSFEDGTDPVSVGGYWWIHPSRVENSTPDQTQPIMAASPVLPTEEVTIALAEALVANSDGSVVINSEEPVVQPAQAVDVVPDSEPVAVTTPETAIQPAQDIVVVTEESAVFTSEEPVAQPAQAVEAEPVAEAAAVIPYVESQESLSTPVERYVTGGLPDVAPVFKTNPLGQLLAPAIPFRNMIIVLTTAIFLVFLIGLFYSPLFRRSTAPFALVIVIGLCFFIGLNKVQASNLENYAPPRDQGIYVTDSRNADSFEAYVTSKQETALAPTVVEAVAQPEAPSTTTDFVPETVVVEVIVVEAPASEPAVSEPVAVEPTIVVEPIVISAEATPEVVPEEVFIVEATEEVVVLAADQAAPAAPEFDDSTSQEGCSISQSFPQDILQWCSYIERYATENGLEPSFVAAIMVQESGGNPVAMSHSGAVGLLQVMPSDGISAGFQCPNGPCFADRPTIEELKDPEFNVRFATKMLRGLINHYGSLRDGLKHYGPSDVGYSYVDKIEAIYERNK